MDTSMAGRTETPPRPAGAGGTRTSTVEVVPGPTVEQRIGRAAVRGVVIGLVVMTALGTGMGLVTGFDLIGSLGIGAFAGFWGGPGFGGMLGATLAYVRAEGPEAQRAVIVLKPPTDQAIAGTATPTPRQRGAA